MPIYSERSKRNLASCHPLLQQIFNTVIKYYDCTILEGYRGREAQNEAYEKGFSKLQYPNSMHNQVPSLAVDAMAYPINWNDTISNSMFIGFVLGIAAPILQNTGYYLVSGIDWNKDRISKETFMDYPHFELQYSEALLKKQLNTI